MSSDRPNNPETANGDSLDFQVPPLIEAAQAAFDAALPQLLKDHSGEWVAYQGEYQVGFARTKTELYQRCFALGLRRGEFVVRRIQPQIDVLPLDPRLVE